MCAYLSTYLGGYEPTYEKRKSSNVIHVDKECHGNSRINVKSIWYHIVLQSGGVV
jgi:hypothetical protein